MDPRMMMGEGEGDSSGFWHMREEKLYRSLAMNGKFAEIDKAKHNEQYKNYLLSNYDEDEYNNGYGF